MKDKKDKQKEPEVHEDIENGCRDGKLSKKKSKGKRRCN